MKVIPSSSVLSQTFECLNLLPSTVIGSCVLAISLFFTKLSPFVMYRQYLFSSGVQFVDFNTYIILQVACRTTQERSTQLMNFSPMRNRILWQRRPFAQNLCSKTRRLLGNKAHLSLLRRKINNKQLFPLGFC